MSSVSAWKHRLVTNARRCQGSPVQAWCVCRVAVQQHLTAGRPPPDTSVPHRAESAHKRTMDDKRRAWDDELAAAEAEATQAQRRLEEKRRELEARLDKEEAAAIANERTSGKEALQKVLSSPRHLSQMGQWLY